MFTQGGVEAKRQDRSQRVLPALLVAVRPLDLHLTHSVLEGSQQEGLENQRQQLHRLEQLEAHRPERLTKLIVQVLKSALVRLKILEHY